MREYTFPCKFDKGELVIVAIEYRGLLKCSRGIVLKRGPTCWDINSGYKFSWYDVLFDGKVIMLPGSILRKDFANEK